MRGGKPKPDAIKIAEGTFRKCRAKKSPAKSSGVPQCPFKAGTIAAKKWREVIAGLKRMGLIDEVDGMHVEGLCRAYQTAQEAEKIVESEGLVVTGAKGALIKHPATLIASDAWNKVRMYGNDLGLNHLSRQRMEANPDETEDTIEAKYLG